MSPGGRPRSGPRSAPLFAPGEPFAQRYTIVEEVGAGGMGQVYKAIDRQVDKPVALKLIRPEAAHGEALLRFRRELVLAQQVTHPNVCRVYDLGEDQGFVYISMEYIDGQGLDDLIQSVGHLSPKQAVAMARQVCAGLAAVHRQGIVHRDLKPGNIMVDRAGHAIVMDFGMAYHNAQDHLTGEGAVLGTLAYLSPEQARGNATDGRSDIYALGLILFEMLTGRRPPADGGTAPMALRDSGERCPPPSRISPEVSPALDALVLRCLERDPARRFASAEKLAEALEQIAGTFSSGISSPLRRLMAGHPRRWRLVAGSALTATAVLIGLAYFQGVTTSGHALTTSPVIAVMSLDVVDEGRAGDHLGVGIADSLITHLAAVPGLTVVSRAATAEYRRAPARKIARDLGLSYLVSLSVHRAAERLRINVNLVRPDDSVAWAYEYEGAAQDVFALESRIAESVTGVVQLKLDATERQRLAQPPAASPAALDDYSLARALLERKDVTGNVGKAIQVLLGAVGRETRFAMAHAALGDAYWLRYQETGDATWADKARASALEALRLDPNQPQVRVALAEMYRNTGEPVKAIEELRGTLSRQPSDVEAHLLLAGILTDQRQWDAAITEGRAAIRLRENFYRCHHVLAYTYYSMGKLPEALVSARRAAELEPTNSRLLQFVGTLYQGTGENGRAIESYDRAIRIQPDAKAYGNLGQIYYVEGRLPEAATALEKAVELLPSSPRQLRYLGDVYQRAGATAKARGSYRRAAELCQRSLKVNPRDPEFLSLLAVVETKLGQHDVAARHLASALAVAGESRDVLYRKATIHALRGDLAAGRAALQAALDKGYSPVLARKDPDLAALSNPPKIAGLVSGGSAASKEVR